MSGVVVECARFGDLRWRGRGGDVGEVRFVDKRGGDEV